MIHGDPHDMEPCVDFGKMFNEDCATKLEQDDAVTVDSIWGLAQPCRASTMRWLKIASMA